jgi:hypothetical protein
MGVARDTEVVFPKGYASERYVACVFWRVLYWRHIDSRIGEEMGVSSESSLLS